MIAAAIGDYLPGGDLVRIVAACLVVSLAAPAAVSLAIAGMARRAEAAERHASPAAGIALIATGVSALVALIALGLYALVQS